MNKTKIAFVIGGLTAGGAERVVSTLANQLSGLYQIIIITLNKEIPFYKLDPSIKVLNCNESYKPSRNAFHAVISNFKILIKINHFIRRENIRLLIGFTTYVNILSVIAAQHNNIPCIISERNNPNKIPIQRVWKFLRKRYYRKANYLVVQTEGIAEFYHTSVDQSKLRIISNPISQELTASRNRVELRENIILSVGRLTEQKAQDKLIDVFASLNPVGWKLHIIGKGPKEPQYRELIKSLDAEDRVKILPPSDDIAWHYQKSSIFVLTSNFEGFPNALIEAMYFGLPCISTNCPTGPSELINNNVNGFLIPLNDQNALEEKMEILMGDKALRDQFGQNAMNSVQRYEVTTIIKEWQYLIEELL